MTTLPYPVTAQTYPWSQALPLGKSLPQTNRPAALFFFSLFFPTTRQSDRTVNILTWSLTQLQEKEED